MSPNSSARYWLRSNGYEDIAEMIDEIIEGWKISGKKTRRNWWEILSGGVNGKPRTIEGREFPVLKVAQIRQGKPITKNSIANNTNENVPIITGLTPIMVPVFKLV